jgi:[acyl-carrier-protein] S-malonyltransferase
MFLDPGKTAFLFPGQGSQSIGMGADLVESFPLARQVFEQADAILDFPLSFLAWEGPEDELNDTINTQPALLVQSVAVLSAFRESNPGFRPAFVAGHSMGEISALVAAQALTFEQALRLARRRGELMKQAGKNSPGGMAAVLGMDLPTLERICSEASQGDQIVQIANDNCPGQVVISGASPALERALEIAREAGARRIRPLAVSIAAHSPLMEHVQIAFNTAVESTPLADPLIPLIGNVTALPLFSAAEIRADLQAQLTSPVRWTESVREMIARGVSTFIELGSGSVLTGLVRRIDPQVVSFALGSTADFEKILLA